MNKTLKVGNQYLASELPDGAMARYEDMPVRVMKGGRGLDVDDMVQRFGPASTVTLVSLPAPQPVEVEGCKTWEDLKDGDTLCGLRWWKSNNGNGFFHASDVYPGSPDAERQVVDALLKAGNKPLRLPDPEPEPEEPDTLEKIVQDLKDADFDGFSERLEALIG